MLKIPFHKGYQCLNTRLCDLDDPSFPLLKKKKKKEVDAVSNILAQLFTATSIDGKNVIEQESKLSLCDGSLQVCCHPKTLVEILNGPRYYQLTYIAFS